MFMRTERTRRQINRFLEVAEEAAAQADWHMALSMPSECWT
jgi:hypothetical protein